MKKIKLRVLYDNVIDYKQLEHQLNELLNQGYELVNSFLGLGIFKRINNPDFKYVVSYKVPFKDEKELYEDFEIIHLINLEDLTIYKAPIDQELYNDETISHEDLREKLKIQSISSLLTFIFDFFILKSIFTDISLATLASTVNLLQILLVILHASLNLVNSTLKIYYYLTHKEPQIKGVLKYTRFTGNMLILTLVLTIVLDFSSPSRLAFTVICSVAVLISLIYIIFNLNYKNSLMPFMILFTVIVVLSLWLDWNDTDLIKYQSLQEIQYQATPHNESFLLNRNSFYVYSPESQNNECLINYYEVKNTPFKKDILKRIDNENRLIVQLDSKELLSNNYDDRYSSNKQTHLLKEGDYILVAQGQISETDVRALFAELNRR